MPMTITAPRDASRARKNAFSAASPPIRLTIAHAKIPRSADAITDERLRALARDKSAPYGVGTRRGQGRHGHAARLIFLRSFVMPWYSRDDGLRPTN